MVRLLNIPLTEKNIFVQVFASNFELIQLKTSFAKLVKVLVLELFSVLVLEYIFNISTRTRTRKFLRYLYSYSFSEVEYSTEYRYRGTIAKYRAHLWFKVFLVFDKASAIFRTIFPKFVIF